MSEPVKETEWMPPSGYRCNLCFDSGRLPTMMAWGGSEPCPVCEQRAIDERQKAAEERGREWARLGRRSTDRPLLRALIGVAVVLLALVAIAMVVAPVRGG